ncbi:MAG: hypothetical protein EOM73_13810, partial [Bacteroidia bacterium]|nr:hypothetical protein [Bacteroidia bacterium]
MEQKLSLQQKLLQKLSGSNSETNFNQEQGIESLRAENSELTEYNARLREEVVKLENEKEQLLAKCLNGTSESYLMQDNGNAVDPDENIELSENNARLLEVVDKLEREKDELLAKLAEVQPQTDLTQDYEITAVRAENNELVENNARLKDEIGKLEEEKEQLLQELSAVKSLSVSGISESEQIIKAGEDAYDVCIEATILSVTLAKQEMVYDLYEIPYLDFTQPWW